MNSTTPRTIVVTGAAQGIGLALVKSFLAEGDKVFGIDINAAALDAAGYVMDWLQVVDQFRWSTHVELVASFRHADA